MCLFALVVVFEGSVSCAPNGNNLHQYTSKLGSELGFAFLAGTGRCRCLCSLEAVRSRQSHEVAVASSISADGRVVFGCRLCNCPLQQNIAC